jgi:hypothetical protein
LISKRSIELKEYLDKKTQKYFDLMVSGPFGVFIDFSKIEPGLCIEPYEIKHLIRRVGNAMAVELSRDVIERILVSLIEGKNLSLKLKMADLEIQNNILFILTDSEFFLIDDKMKLSEGKTILNRWEINVTEECNAGEDNKDKIISYTSWKDLLRGKFEVMLPKQSYFLGRSALNLSYYNKRLSKWFSENKVPTFMRFSFPVIFKDDKMFYEFLSGKKRFKESVSDSYYRISFKLSCLK